MRYLRPYGLKRIFSRVVFMIFLLGLVLELAGCESFGRKFARKPTKPRKPEEMVLAPEDYSQQMPNKEELYRQYYLYWQSWQDELIYSLGSDSNRKKALECIIEAEKNLANMRGMLADQLQVKLDTFIVSLGRLKEDIIRDEYFTGAAEYTGTAERIGREVSRGFSYSKIRDYLK